MTLYQPGSTGPGPPGRSGGITAQQAFAAIVILLVGVGLGVMLGEVVRDDNGSDTATGQDDPGTGPGIDSATSTTVFDAGSAQLPEALIGRWDGTITQTPEQSTYEVEMELTQSSETNQVGTVTYPDLHCSGHYVIDEVRETSVTLIETITEGKDKCVNSEITLEYVDSDELTYSFDVRDSSGHGSLSRSE